MRRIFFAIILSFAAYASAAVIDVKSVGAKGDSSSIDSPFINKAISMAAANGGGTVYIPAGKYLCYSIHLLSNVTIHIENGAQIIAAFPSATEGFDAAEPNDNNPFQDYGHSHWHNSLFWAVGQHDITICGEGLIFGAGLSREESRLVGVGNKAIALKECYNVNIKDINMLHCGHFAILATGVDNLNIYNVHVDTNRDGFDIDACRNVRISNCSVNSPWDDAIVLKASYGLRYYRDCENITISDCFVSGYDQGSVMNASFQTLEPQAPDHGKNCGRIKIGTESSGGFKNITITNCTFDHCRGFALETVDGGCMENVTVSNLVMRDIVNSPIFLRLGARQRSPKGAPFSEMRRIKISHIAVSNADSEFACIISGIPGHLIEDVVIDDVSIDFIGGYSADDGKLTPEENIAVYPEPWMFGRIPAKGFYIRHVDGIRLDNIRLNYQQPDGRPLLGGYDVKNAQYGSFIVDKKNIKLNNQE